MEVFYDLMPKGSPGELNHTGSSIGLGFFDGVHLAHKKIVENVVKLARDNSKKSAIITFKKSPFECLHPEERGAKYLTTNEQKIEILSEMGLDYLYLLDFDTVCNLTGEKYIEEILFKKFKPGFITTGFNNHFGCARSGNAKLLHDLAPKFQYEYFEIPPQKVDGVLISSTKIKEFVASGDLNKVRAFLGRDFEIENVVEVGTQLGRTIGFPTANILWKKDIVQLPFGVYSGHATVSGVKYRALINWGARPTVDNKSLVEVHILDFDKDIYGQKIAVCFEQKIRDIVKFASIEDLKTAIQKDCAALY